MKTTSLSKSFAKLGEIQEISVTQDTPENQHDTPEDLDVSNVLMRSFFNNKDLVQMTVDIK